MPCSETALVAAAVFDVEKTGLLLLVMQTWSSWLLHL